MFALVGKPDYGGKTREMAVETAKLERIIV